MCVTYPAIHLRAIGLIGNQISVFLIVDTGSSNTWVGATTPFEETGTTTPTGDEVFVQYGSGFFFGDEVIDTVDFGGPLVIPQQSIGTAVFSDGFQGVDGIVGIGPTGLTAGTVDNEGTIPTVTDNLFALGIIPDPVVSVFFAPTNDTFDVNGELVFGGIDPGAFTGDLIVFPLTTTFPSSEFFGVDASFVQSGATILDSAGIVDTGTTLVLLADDAFESYLATTGAVIDNNVGLFTVTPDQFATLPTLEVILSGVTFPLTPDAQRLPAQLVPAFGGDPDLVYLIVSNIGSDSGSGFDFVLGQFFLERFYSVFDSRGGGAVAFAPTVFTNAVVNN
ncbi:acid protease [Exidia glandulosa HHB12029]|uniref:Acid protease n=1 Tax=Exidia glandulosa HHB12029 TaxID=1314781 RepID=A0A165KRG7_EXIGL|nr:acid protease [Exidia glandulosa HHB12029]